MGSISKQGNLMKFLRTALLALLLLPSLVWAHPAEDLIRQVTGDLIAALNSPSADSDKNFVRSTIDKDVLPHIDFSTMTKITLGSKAWKKASKEQRADLVSEFRELLLNTYTAALDQYSGQKLEILPHTPAENDDKVALVKTVFDDANVKIPVDYKLKTSKSDRNTWKVYDIEVENVSLVKSYKAEFSNQIKEAGVDGLIKTLREKNAK